MSNIAIATDGFQVYTSRSNLREFEIIKHFQRCLFVFKNEYISRHRQSVEQLCSLIGLENSDSMNFQEYCEKYACVHACIFYFAKRHSITPSAHKVERGLSAGRRKQTKSFKFRLTKFLIIWLVIELKDMAVKFD